MVKKIVLFEDKKSCCGCGACMNACPKNAISMKPDEYGFLYPTIDDTVCIECGVCMRSCGYKDNKNLQQPRIAYAASASDATLLKRSASGGVFAVIAHNFIKCNGVVYGAVMNYDDKKMVTRHQRAVTQVQVNHILGSKYVQSDLGFEYRNAKKDLTEGKKLLFSGTPCQIAGLKKYLGKDYDNLFTIEIICHGVPNAVFFQEFIACLGRKYHSTIDSFLFRDKSKGQGMMSRVHMTMPNGKTKKIVKSGRFLSYFSLFLHSLIYRDSCYSCPFACGKRGADLTLGDFWGFHEEYPTINKKQGFSNDSGISCILVNTDKGEKLLNKYGVGMQKMLADFDKIAKHNDQLIHPSKYSAEREKILNIYVKHGYDGVEKYFKDNFKIDRLKTLVTMIIPKGIRRLLSKIKGILK